MLKTRIITALMLIPAIVGTVLFAPQLLFAGILGAVLLLGAWECAHLIGLTQTAGRLAFTIAAAAALILTYWIGAWFDLSVIVLGVWLLICGWLCLPQLGRSNSILARSLKGLASIATYAGALAACLYLRTQEDGRYLLMVVFILVWAADSGAYFCGRKFGKRKLAPSISPGKTWAGLVGGILFAILAGLLCGLLLQLEPTVLLWFCAMTVPVVLLSVIGDLFISLIKRQAGAKDTGSLLPGHGGILDRIDSILAAAPLFTVLLVYLLRTHG